MSHRMSIDQAAAKLPELVNALKPDEEIVLTQNGWPVAKIVSLQLPSRRREPGSAMGILTIVSDDEEHLDDFREYQAQSAVPTKENKGIWSKLLKLAGRREPLPPDAARQHDHYLYGLPRQ